MPNCLTAVGMEPLKGHGIGKETLFERKDISVQIYLCSNGNL